ncbi:hypothetical protein KA517_04905 [Candidatus Gracilibacteria bacterium]|nr:hypothetical protein [Candidatus Gracilibacteria bacterium]
MLKFYQVLDLPDPYTTTLVPLPKLRDRLETLFRDATLTQTDINQALQALPEKDHQLKRHIERFSNGIEQALALAHFTDFKYWQAYPDQAAVAWLGQLYHKRTWLSAHDLATLRKMSVAGQRQCLLETCWQRSQLRNLFQPIRTISLQPNQIEKTKPIQEILYAQGIDQHHLVYRRIKKPDQKHWQRIIEQGTDRDNTASISHHNGFDGEALSMIKQGIDQISHTTYIDPVTKQLVTSSLASGNTYLFYCSDALTEIGPNGAPRTNGFAAFHFPEVIQQSLVAVIQT